MKACPQVADSGAEVDEMSVSMPQGTTAGEVAAAIVFLLSAGATAITGQSIVVDAGATG